MLLLLKVGLKEIHIIPSVQFNRIFVRLSFPVEFSVKFNVPCESWFIVSDMVDSEISNILFEETFISIFFVSVSSVLSGFFHAVFSVKVYVPGHSAVGIVSVNVWVSELFEIMRSYSLFVGDMLQLFGRVQDIFGEYAVTCPVLFSVMFIRIVSLVV